MEKSVLENPILEKISLTKTDSGNRFWKNRIGGKTVLENPILEYIGVGKKVFGKSLSVYHSKFSNQERFEVWNNVVKNNEKAKEIKPKESPINKEIVNLITSHGGRAVGLSGKDGGLIRAKKMVGEGKNKNFDFKNTGMVSSIDPSVVNLLDATPFIPVIAPIGIGEDFKTYNINADIVAGKIAKILQAGKYVVLTNTTGIFDDNGNLIKSMNAEQVRQLVNKGIISSGMLPKVESALEAVSAGVQNVQIIDGTIDHAILLELFTDEGVGTMIRRT